MQLMIVLFVLYNENLNFQKYASHSRTLHRGFEEMLALPAHRIEATSVASKPGGVLLCNIAQLRNREGGSIA